jgi:ribosomal protein S11
MAKQIEKQLKNEDSETTKRCSSPINFNNTIVTITNLKGEVISWSSVGPGLKLVNRRLCC